MPPERTSYKMNTGVNSNKALLFHFIVDSIAINLDASKRYIVKVIAANQKCSRKTSIGRDIASCRNRHWRMK